jgi:hypothetical protein
MSNTMDILFGPLDKKFCLYFYYLSIFALAFVALTIISFMWVGISKKLDSRHYIHMIYIALIYFVFYFQNRLLYSMCAK